ncbi:MAG TPA: hydroxymethylglutaryl-CoA synthase [Gammaproteobacteria bacterium]|jgi:hydroxymethylglutaryl-CoA synthase|nr:hydroxymethylglutaryl-CoA synthase [Gammaproteobacteria bacterium]
MSVGIDEISFYTPNYYLDLRTLAKAKNIEVEKYYNGIGQEKMSMPGHDEDIVTMAANAAKPIIDHTDTSSIRTLLFATETGVDQSKSAGVYAHRLLGLSPNCRVVELKQACYSATAAIQMACALVARQPEQKVLVLASDIARYDLGSPGEATQGCGAVAMVVSAKPRLVEIDPDVGNFAEDVMDFWRPNYRSNALVDGKYSTKVYLHSLKKAWENFVHSSSLAFTNFSHFCYHLPFSRMAEKAHRHLSRINNSTLNLEAMTRQFEDSLHYNRVIGNSYTASIYISLVSLLENCKHDLEGKKIGFFSYGSGCVSEFFSGTVVSGYDKFLHTLGHQKMLAEREEVDYETYLALYHYPEYTDGEAHSFEAMTKGHFRLAGVNGHKREYVSC